jgi:hypothetical protein
MSRLLVMVLGTVGLVGVASACSSTPSTTEAIGSSSAALDTSDWVAVPGTHRLWHPSCVHVIPNGAEGKADGTVWLGVKVIATYEGCMYPPKELQLGGTGWVEWTNENVPTPQYDFAYMTSQWVVPSAPAANDGDWVAFFTAFQTTGDYYGGGAPYGIAQPVLAYGLFGHQYWEILSEELVGQCPGVGCYLYETGGVTVNTNDVIVGTIYDSRNEVMAGGMTYCYSVATGIEAEDITPPGAFTSMFAPWEPWTTAQSGVLETSNISACNQFPTSNSVSFTSPTLLETQDPLCNEPNANIITDWGYFAAGGGFPACGWNILLNASGPGSAMLSWNYSL